MNTSTRWTWFAVALIAGAALLPRPAAAEVLTCEVAVVGGGSAGFAAALAAAEQGCSTILVEKEQVLGGTSTISGVNNWEPVCGATGTPRRVYERLAAIPGACGIWGQKYHSAFGDSFPGAYLEIDSELTYDDTLRRHGPEMTSDKAAWLARYHGIVFEPDALDTVMRQMLAETGRCRVLSGVAYSSCVMTDGKVTELILADGKVIRPKVVIDACGYVAKDAGCRSEMSDSPNGVSLIFRVSSNPDAPEIPVPTDTPSTCWWGSFPQVWCVQYPNGDLGINMLPTMSGSEAQQLGSEAAYAECQRRVFAQWKWMKAEYPQHFADFKITHIFPRLGYRETHRIVCEHTLTGAEVAGGAHFEDEIATADHAFDSHGASSAYSGELSQPYGIPLRSLKPIGVVNMYVAGRIAGFDEAAASSCRLSRTMMQLGEAAGRAAAQDVKGSAVRPVDLRVEGTNAVITVGAGAVDSDSGLWLVYGPEDGGLDLDAWSKKTQVATVTSAGGTFEVAIPDREKYAALYLRAVIVNATTYTGLRTDNQAYINLNETPEPGRRYEIRFSHKETFKSAGGMVFLFGGVGRTGGTATSMFQVYGGLPKAGDPCDWYAGSQSDANYGSCQLFNAQAEQVWDVRIDYGATKQEYYWKAAESNAYIKAGESAIDHATAGYKGDLYLFARNDNGAKFSSFNTSLRMIVYGYKVTDISSGQVVKNLEPVMDAQGEWVMIDTISGDSYGNAAGSGAFSDAVYYSSGSFIASPLAVYAGVRLTAVSAKTLQVTVDPGIADGSQRLMLCWGSEHHGEDVGNWEHCLAVSDAVPSDGFVGEISCKANGLGDGDWVRAVLAPFISVRHVDACRADGGVIDLGMAVPRGRQYDIRCKFNVNNPLFVGNALFGGLTQDKTKIFQVYADKGVIKVWLGDTENFEVFTPESGEFYDLRVVLRDGAQEVYYKKASAADYSLAVSKTKPNISTDIHLALLGRYLGATIQPSDKYTFFNRFTETELATGKVLRHLIPVRYGENYGQTMILDLVSGQEFAGASSSLAYSQDEVELVSCYGTAVGLSSLLRWVNVPTGLVIICH